MDDREKRTGFFREMVIATLFFVVSIFAIIEAVRITNNNRFPTELPGFFPLLMSVSMLVCSICILMEVIQRREKGIEPYSSRWELLKQSVAEEIPLDVLLIIAASIVYVVLMTWIGYLASTFLFLLAAALYCGRGKIKLLKAVLITAICVAALYVVFFVCFKVLLP